MKKRRLKDRIWSFFFDDCMYLFLNYFVARIPFWTIRKLLYRMCGMKIGKGSRIAMRCIVIARNGCHGIVIGKDNVINEHVLLDGRNNLTIGDSNSISMFAKIYTGSHISNSNSFEYYGKSTVIGNNTWIGVSAVILPNTTIHDFAIIGANSLFKGEAEEKGIYVGVPATLTRHREVSEHYSLNYRSYFR